MEILNALIDLNKAVEDYRRAQNDYMAETHYLKSIEEEIEHYEEQYKYYSWKVVQTELELIELASKIKTAEAILEEYGM